MTTRRREKPISEIIPCQPIELDPNGVPRFRGNAYVRWMYDKLGEMSVSPLREPGFDELQGDYVQLMQLLGYSVSGYGDLDFVPREEVERADAEAEKLLRSKP